MSASFQEWIKKLDRPPRDGVGLDFGETGLKAVRLRKGPQGLTLVAADILPPVTLPIEPAAGFKPAALNLPKSLQAPYAALALSSDLAVVKLLSFPGDFTSETEGQILAHMGLDRPDQFRISYKLLTEGRSRSESRVLAAALPTAQAAMTPQTVRAPGAPAPRSIEVASLAALTALIHRKGEKTVSETVASLELGARSSLFALFTKNIPVLIRKFDFGTDTVIQQVQQGAGVSADVAREIVNSGSIDISHWLTEAAQPFIKQLLLSRDFVERRENCRISQFFLTGGGAGLLPLRQEIEKALGLTFQLWNPLDGLTADPNAIAEGAKGQEHRLAAAFGAALSLVGAA